MSTTQNAPRKRSGSPPMRFAPGRFFLWAGVAVGFPLGFSLWWWWAWTWPWAYVVGVNLSTFALYAYDKLAARRQTWWRVPERVLHGFALAGGTPAALLAQQWLRHKTLKTPFQYIFWAVLGMQAVVLLFAWWFFG